MNTDKYALVKSFGVSKITPVRSKNWTITVSVFLSTLQQTALLLKKFRLRLHCYTLRERKRDRERETERKREREREGEVGRRGCGG